jgi:hypothetical protein
MRFGRPPDNDLTNGPDLGSRAILYCPAWTLQGENGEEIDAAAVRAFMGNEPTRAEIDALQGPVLLEFGAEW